MDEGGSIALLVNFLEVDDKTFRIVLGVRQNLRAEQGNDVIGDDTPGFVLEIGIVDAKVGVEPVDLACN